jgi:hypothetical protein
MIVILIATVASPILGIVRGVKNGAVISAVISVCVPVYGLIYFFTAKRPRT